MYSVKKSKAADHSVVKESSGAGFFSANRTSSTKSEEIKEMAMALGGIGLDTDIILSSLPLYVFEGSIPWLDDPEVSRNPGIK